MIGLAAAPAEDIRGLKPFLEGTVNPWAIALVALLVAAVVAVLAFRRRPRRPAPAADPDSTPRTPRTLRGRLDALRDSSLNDSAQSGKFCEQLSEILRDFVAQRYGLMSRRLTSSELAEAMREHGVPREITDLLEDVFGACDLVKFARLRLTNPDLARHLTSAYLVLEYAGRTGGAAR